MSEVLGTVDRPKERPFPWYCPKCRKKDVWREVIRYECQRLSEGRFVDVLVPDLAVPRCRSCGELILDYAAESQINAQSALRGKEVEESTALRVSVTGTLPSPPASPYP